jgi:hypothetical protein
MNGQVLLLPALDDFKQLSPENISEFRENVWQ